MLFLMSHFIFHKQFIKSSDQLQCNEVAHKMKNTLPKQHK